MFFLQDGSDDGEDVITVSFPDDDETPNDIYISDYSRFIIVDGPPNTGNYTVYVSDSWNPENNSKFITLVNRTGAYMYFENQFNTYGIESGNAVDFVIIDGACYRTE